MKKPLKIAMITPYLPPRLGGREYWVPQMSKELLTLGCDIKIYCANVSDFYANKARLEEGEYEGVPFVKASTPIDINKYSTPVTIPPFKHLKVFDPDIIHIHEPNLILTTVLALYGKWVLKKKVVMHNYSDPFDWIGGSVAFKLFMKFYSRIHLLKLRVSDSVIVISEEYRDYARYFKRFKEKISIIPMCLADVFEQDPTIDKEPRTVLYAGRLDVRKGIEYLIRACAKLENLTLLIAGSGEKEVTEFLHKEADEARSLNSSVSIEFLGKHNQLELNALYNRSTVLVLPTADPTAETFGAVLLEAWATKTPVISANNQAPMKLIHESGGGLIAERTNAQDLAEKISEIVDNPDLAASLGEKGFSFATKNYSFKENAVKLKSLYDNLIG